MVEIDVLRGKIERKLNQTNKEIKDCEARKSDMIIGKNMVGRLAILTGTFNLCGFLEELLNDLSDDVNEE